MEELELPVPKVDIIISEWMVSGVYLSVSIAGMMAAVLNFFFAEQATNLKVAAILSLGVCDLSLCAGYNEYVTNSP